MSVLNALSNARATFAPTNTHDAIDSMIARLNTNSTAAPDAALGYATLVTALRNIKKIVPANADVTDAVNDIIDRLTLAMMVARADADNFMPFYAPYADLVKFITRMDVDVSRLVA